MLMNHPCSTDRRFRSLLRAALAITASLALFALASPALAQSVIKQPGHHPDYAVELEPHFVLRWGHPRGAAWADEGIGLGLRATIPFLHQGPIKTINNSMGIGFGLDWTHHENPCWDWFWGFRGIRGGPDPRFWNTDCSADTFQVPVVLQWNFWLTDIISVFGEPGLAFVHTRWSWEYYCGAAPGPLCEFNESDSGVEFVFWGGGRFMFGDTVGAVVRVGWPSVTAGVTFLL